MKCPKCGYLGYEQVDRCRNCGYDFSLAETRAVAELPIRFDSELEEGPAGGDLALTDPALSRADAIRPERPPSSDSSFETSLPLFGGPIADDTPLITRPSPPRPPLAVRRATPELPRFKDAARAPMLDLDLGATSSSLPAALRPTAYEQEEEASQPRDASLFARLFAVALDLAILAVVDVVVIYFTAQICGLTMEELSVLPKAPLIAFILVQNIGYLVAFTAGGQTLGKMATGIRVVAEEADSPLDLGRAVLRTLLWFVLAIPAGLGFASAIFDREHRGLHDRFAGTRVVRAVRAV